MVKPLILDEQVVKKKGGGEEEPRRSFSSGQKLNVTDVYCRGNLE